MGTMSGTTAVRLTRRGRLVVVTGTLLTLLAVGFGMTHAPSQAAGRAVKPPTVTVQPGETLWALAERIAPQVDPRLVIAQIERLNHLRTPQVFGGQQLVVPLSR
jgi:LysM repeat protein